MGDNPFFGIDHLSQERARSRAQELEGFGKIAEIIDYVTKYGTNRFVVSTHPELKNLIKYIKDNTDLVSKLKFLPILPYAQGYITRVTEKGIVGAVNDILAGSTADQKLKMIFQGSVGFVTKDFKKLLQTFIDLELAQFNNVTVETIFLHNVVTDLAISLGMRQVIEVFADHIKTRYKAKVGLVTKNFPKLVSTLKSWGINLPVVMTSFNPIGYQMNPSRQACEDCISQNNLQVIAMNVLAGGYLKPTESASYLKKLGLPSAVIGMSSKSHVDETMSAFGVQIPN